MTRPIGRPPRFVDRPSGTPINANAMQANGSADTSLKLDLFAICRSIGAALLPQFGRGRLSQGGFFRGGLLGR